MTADVSELTAFAGRLRRAPSEKRRKVRATTVKAAVNIKKAVKADLSTSSNPGIRAIPIEYEEPFLSSPGQVTIEIGPAMRAGGLANVAFFGTYKGGGTHRFWEHAEAEAEVWTRYLAEAMEGL